MSRVCYFRNLIVEAASRPARLRCMPAIFSGINLRMSLSLSFCVSYISGIYRTKWSRSPRENLLENSTARNVESRNLFLMKSAPSSRANSPKKLLHFGSCLSELREDSAFPTVSRSGETHRIFNAQNGLSTARICDLTLKIRPYGFKADRFLRNRGERWNYETIYCIIRKIHYPVKHRY